MNRLLKILLVAALCVVTTTVELFAQEEITISTDTTQQEKISTLDAAWAPVLLDHSIGIRAGWGTGTIRREPARDGTKLTNPLWNFGINYRFDVPEQKYVGTILFELQFVQKGFAYLMYFDDSGDAYTRTYDMIEFPILWQPYFPISKKNDSRIYLSAGPFVSYSFGARESYYNADSGEIYSEGEYEMDSEEDYFWNYGIAVGLGLNIAINERFSLQVDGRYTIQLSDMQRGPEYVTGNPFRTPVDHMGVSVGMQYKFAIGTGGGKKKKE